MDGLTRWIAAARWRTFIVVTLVSLAVLLPGQMTLPVTDRDEARFAQASKQMLETGDLIDIRFQDQPRWKKPAGIYWLQAGAASLFGGVDAPIWAYRLPSAVAGLLVVWLTLWAARPLAGGRGALFAGLMMATTLLLVAEGHIAKTDAALCATAVAALGALAHLFFGSGGRGAALVFWLALAASILLKGPIVPVIVVFALIGLASRRSLWPGFKRLGALWGVPLTVALVAPWLVAIYLKSDGAFFAESLGKDMGAKIASGQEAHWGPPGLYLGLVWLTLWPWAALLPAVVPWVWAQRRSAWIVFMVAWIVPFWLILEAVPTKLPHYVLPLYPALVLCIAAWMAHGPGLTQRWMRISAAVLVALPGALIAAAVIAAPWVIDLIREDGMLGVTIDPAGAALAAAALVMIALAARAAWRGRLMAQIGSALMAALLLYPAILQFTLPGAHLAFPSPHLAQVMAQHRPCALGPGYALGYHEPSLVFLTQTDLVVGDVTRIVDALRSDPGAMVLMEDRWAEIIGDGMPEVIERAQVTYFNPNRGKFATARLLTQDDPRWSACTDP